MELGRRAVCIAVLVGYLSAGCGNKYVGGAALAGGGLMVTVAFVRLQVGYGEEHDGTPSAQRSDTGLLLVGLVTMIAGVVMYGRDRSFAKHKPPPPPEPPRSPLAPSSIRPDAGQLTRFVDVPRVGTTFSSRSTVRACSAVPPFSSSGTRTPVPDVTGPSIS